MSNPVTLKKTPNKKKLKLVDEFPTLIDILPTLSVPVSVAIDSTEPCNDINKDIEKIDSELKRLTDEKKALVKQCNDLKYILKEAQPQTLMALLKYIFYNRIETYDGLMNRFPDSKERMGGLYTKNYVFEALWKIIFLLKFDNLIDPEKYKRIYIGSLEKNGKVFSEYEYLADAGGIEKVNSGSKSGICDFYFTIEENPTEERKDKSDPNKITWACEESPYKPEPKGAYMFTSKFYEKSHDISKFDYQNIALEAIKKHGDKESYKIVALVKNAEDLRKVLMGGSTKAIKDYADSKLIFDEADLRNTYYPTLYKWLTNTFTKVTNNIEEKKVWTTLLKNVKSVFKIADNLRFHQKYVVDYTNKVIKENLAEQSATGKAYNPGRFIWGAVARSGKSYMIGGLVAKRNPRIVILLLGAINETKSQFIDDLFQTYTDLQEYIPLDLQEDAVGALDKYNADTKKEKKFVIVISQESLRAKVFKDQCLNTPGTLSTACESFFIEHCNKKKIEAKYCEEHEQKINKDNKDTYNSKYAKKNETMKKNMLKKKNKTTIKAKAKKGKVEKTATTIVAEIVDDDDDVEITVPYNDSQISFIKELLKEKEKIIFFDEIHQGGGADSLQEQTIKFFYDEKYPKPLLIMVTATYSKPLGKYGKKLDDQDIVLILWSYEMIMLMKTFTLDYVTYDKNVGKDDIATYLIDTGDEQFAEKMDLLHKLTLELNASGVSCEAIAQTYEKNPELVYLLPTLNDADIEMDVGEGKKLNIRHNLKEFFEIDRGTDDFLYENELNNILTYINKNVYNNLLYKEYGFIANGGGKNHTQLWFLPTSMKNTGVKKSEVTESEENSIIGPMAYQLAKAIINHPDFINFNVCVIHGKTAFDNKYADLESDTDLKNRVTPRKAFFRCIRDKNKKLCISDIEKKGKSLIILTGQMLRLGISLPCADVAIHMDSINAYDIIYQSMFRVLTERPGKKQGFFVDMVLDRAIKFFYKYTNVQQKFSKQTVDSEPTVIEGERERVRKNLLLFDVGSISKSLGFSSISTPVNSYNHIAETFKIHSNKEFEKEKTDIFKKENDDDYEKPEKVVDPPVEKKEKPSSEKIKKSKEEIVKQLEILHNDDVYRTALEDLMKHVDKKFVAESEKTAKNVKRAKAFNNPVDLGNDAEQAANKALNAEKIEEEKKQAKLLKDHFKNIVEQIQNTFSLYILFNSNVTLAEIIKDNDALTRAQISKIRTCTDDDILYYCYLLVSEYNINEISDEITDEKIQEIINNHTEIIRFLVQNHESVKNPIETLFNNIKDEMRPLQEKLKLEAVLFKETSLKNAQSFCPAIYTEKHTSVLEIIRKYLTPKKDEKKLFGEVFTPIELVCDMLSALPIEVWANPYLTWLDPANGIGNFPIIVYFKLMVTLSAFKDDTLDLTEDKNRSKHIIEKMLYMNELNPINVALCIKLFNMIDPNAIPNVTKGDFIEIAKNIKERQERKEREREKEKEKEREEKKGKKEKQVKPILKEETSTSEDVLNIFTNRTFDIIIGNPPFQETNAKGSSKHGSGKLYPDFITYALDILISNGFLLFLTPNTWCTGASSKTGKILDLFKQYNLLKLNNNNISKAFPSVGTGTLVYFLLQKNNKYETTELINTSTYKFSIKDKPFLPNILNRFSISICEKTLFSQDYVKFELIKDSGPYHLKYGSGDKKTFTTRSDDTDWVTEEPDENHIYHIFHSSNITLYSSKANFFQENKKLLLSNSGAIDPLYDNGELGFTQNSSAILVNSKEDGDKIIKLFKSKLYLYLEKCVRYSMAISIHYLSFFPYPKDIRENFTDKDVYTYFNLTAEEIEEIEHTV
jgi:hypothetical protein